MPAESLQRRAVLLVHDDSLLLDRLTRVFEGRGFSVGVAATAFAATAQLEGRREIDVVVAGWDAGRGLGAEVYRWALRHRFSLRAQFVFVASDAPRDFDELVEGRCLVLPPDDTEEIIRVAEATATRSDRLSRLSEADLAWLDAGRPSLLLADDEPMQLRVMARHLSDLGFSVTAVESGNAATTQLEATDFDAILVDWHMPDGSGADLFRWIVTFRPWLVERVVFLSGTTHDEIQESAAGRPVVLKGQDSGALVDVLMQVAHRGNPALVHAPAMVPEGDGVVAAHIEETIDATAVVMPGDTNVDLAVVVASDLDA